MAGPAKDFEAAANGPLDTDAVNAHRKKWVSEQVPPKDFTNKAEYEERLDEGVRRRVGNVYTREVAAGRTPTTGGLIKEIESLPKGGYEKIYEDNGKMERRVFDSTDKGGVKQLSPDAMKKLNSFDGASDSLQNLAREGGALEEKGADKLAAAAKKEGVTASQVVDFSNLTSKDKLPDDIAKPLLDAQARMEAKEAAPAAAPKVATPAPS